MKLFLKKPEQSQGLVQKVLQAATAENDNPDIRDRAYVYWRLLSSDPQITKVSSRSPHPTRSSKLTWHAQNVVLSEKPPITTTIQSLPPALLESLITDLSTLASVYHKSPETFLGQGRFGAEAMQKAAIEEQLQLAKENPTVAAIAAATASGGSVDGGKSNVENLLDIDFDGSAPASLQGAPSKGTSGLEGLAGTPQRVASPAAGQPSNTMDDLMGVFGNGGGSSATPASAGGNGLEDLMGGFGGMDVNGGSQPPPPQSQLKSQGGKQTNDDILGLF